MNNVVLIGLVSFFADLSSEMVYPLLLVYLRSVPATAKEVSC
jgi:hypothetical protein